MLLPLELREPLGDERLGSLGVGVAVGVRVDMLVASSEIRLCWYL